jgi:hypothetical protein
MLTTSRDKDNFCSVCGALGETKPLERCPVCSKYFCGDCCYRGSGRRLCSERCKMILFYGDQDDPEAQIDDE